MLRRDSSGKIQYSVQLTFFTIYFMFIAFTVGLLNTYPIISSRDAVFSAKRGMMINQASVMASSLSALEELDAANVQQVMELVDVNAFDRVLVSDADGLVLYDTADSGGAAGRYALFPELVRALKGEVLFFSRYDGDAFSSRAASPIVGYGGVIGSVYLYEYDSAQALLIKSIQTRLRSISLMVAFWRCLRFLPLQGR